MNIKERLQGLFETERKGKENAIKRWELLSRLYDLGYVDLNDRGMREGYEDLPVCGDESGLYFPCNEQECTRQIELIEKKIRAYWRKRKVLKKYRLNGQPKQGRLF